MATAQTDLIIEFVRVVDRDFVPHPDGGQYADAYNTRLFQVALPGSDPEDIYIWTDGRFLDETYGLSTSTRFDEAALRALYREIIEADVRENVVLSNRRPVRAADRGRWGERFVAIADRG